MMDCGPATLDWCLIAGDTETLVVVLPDLDATDRTYVAHIKRASSLSTPPLVEIAVDVMLVGDDTEVVLTLTSEQTAMLGLLRSHLVWDLQETVDTTITTLLGGKVTVKGDVTR